jgi:hypothetical protein
MLKVVVMVVEQIVTDFNCAALEAAKIVTTTENCLTPHGAK